MQPLEIGSNSVTVSVLMKRQMTERVDVSVVTGPATEEDSKNASFVGSVNATFHSCSVPGVEPSSSTVDVRADNPSDSRNMQNNMGTQVQKKKKTKQNQQSQLSLTSFFMKVPNSNENWKSFTEDGSKRENISTSHDSSKEIPEVEKRGNVEEIASIEEHNVATASCPPEIDKKTNALLEWQRIQQFMQDSIPLCEGHREPCVARVVKKPGPNCGRRFYVCARAEGPASNPETRCDFFRWAGSKSRQKK